MRQRLVLFNRPASLSTLAAPPASTSRPVLSSPPRLPSEAPKQSQHSQLALTQPTPTHHPPLIQPGITPHPPPFIVPAHRPQKKKSAVATDPPRAHKRPRLNYHLDAAAYGIAKHRRAYSTTTNAYPHTARSVQVGEDAYFLRDNALGIADGVGGWARSSPPAPHHPSPSALFSRRLMHFCSTELDALPPPPISSSNFSFSPSHADLEEDLAASLDDLADGIDVLNILERAYDSTVRAHTTSQGAPTPLTTGSSTALLAVLDHPPQIPGSLPQSPPAPQRNYARGSLDSVPDIQVTSDLQQAPDAVLHIAHLGDCMGMLVRGDAIAWRSDEMWWGYNHPLQLGPPRTTSPSATSSSAPLPSASASSSSTSSTPPAPPSAPYTLPVQPHTFTLPVRADDILILASDGLCDNLWDEDVLDEVVRLRRGFWDAQDDLSSSALSRMSSSSPSHPSPKTHPSSSQLPPFPHQHRHQHTELRRKAFASMLSEALCSRAKRISEMRPVKGSNSPTMFNMKGSTDPATRSDGSKAKDAEISPCKADTGDEIRSGSPVSTDRPVVAPASSSGLTSTESTRTMARDAVPRRPTTSVVESSSSSMSSLASSFASISISSAASSTSSTSFSLPRNLTSVQGDAQSIQRNFELASAGKGAALSHNPARSVAAGTPTIPSIGAVLASTVPATATTSTAPTPNPISTSTSTHTKYAITSANTTPGGPEAQDTVGAGEVPFARRARLAGRVFRGGKSDDISVVVAVISPLLSSSIQSSSSSSQSAAPTDRGTTFSSAKTLHSARAHAAHL